MGASPLALLLRSSWRLELIETGEQGNFAVRPCSSASPSLPPLTRYVLAAGPRDESSELRRCDGEELVLHAVCSGSAWRPLVVREFFSSLSHRLYPDPFSNVSDEYVARCARS